MTIELIDIHWLQGDALIAVFEVEHIMAIHSELFRKSDLMSISPNINIDLFIAAPDQSRKKTASEVSRPTFARQEPSLPRICRFSPSS